MPEGEGDEESSNELQSEPEPRKEPEQDKERAPTPERDKIRPSQWARFHKEQKDFFAQKQEHQAEMAEARRVQELLANAKSDRLAALEALGYTNIKEFVEGLAEDGGRESPERRELRELKEWRKSQEKREQEQQSAREVQQQQAAVQAKLDALRTDIQNRLKSDRYNSRVVNLKDSHEQVMVEMDRMATETGEMPDIDEAIERVDGRFQSYLKEMAENPAILSFFREKLGVRQSGRSAAPQSKQRAQTRTIGGNTPAPGLQQTDSSEGPKTQDELLEEALEFFRS